MLFGFKKSEITIDDGTKFFLVEPVRPKRNPKHFIIFFHGLTESRLSLMAFEDLLKIKDAYIVSFDLLNHGDNIDDREFHFETWHDEQVHYVRKLLDYLKKENNAEKFIFFAVSFGGAVALEFSALYPQYVERLILYAPAIPECVNPNLTGDISQFFDHVAHPATNSVVLQGIFKKKSESWPEVTRLFVLKF